MTGKNRPQTVPNERLHHRLNAFFCSAKAGNLSELAGGVNDLAGQIVKFFTKCFPRAYLLSEQPVPLSRLCVKIVVPDRLRLTARTSKTACFGWSFRIYP